MIDERCEVLSNDPVSADCRRMVLRGHRSYADARPGQFVMIRTAEGPAPLLRRPFSIHRCRRLSGNAVAVEILYRVVGEGTRKMADCNPGRLMAVLGPLGRGFSDPPASGPVFLAAGGMGVAPMVFLAERLCKTSGGSRDIRVFLGGKSAGDLLCRDLFEEFGLPVTPTTDDGSHGDRCLVTQPLEEAIRKNPPAALYACGPPGMLRCVVGFVETYEVRCQVSIETLMACGVGACLACAVTDRKKPDRYLHACQHGPVFDAREVII